MGCKLLRRGFNDHYAVTDGNGARYMLRVYLHHKYWIRSEGDFRFELELLNHLQADGVGVSCALARRCGDFLGALEAPEGRRCYALFTWAPGQPAGEYTLEQSRLLGGYLARLHRSADRFQSPFGRYNLDTHFVIERPLEQMRPYFETDRPEDWAFITHLAARVRGRMAALPTVEGAWGYIHGDAHGGNAHFTAENLITMFDFDHGGFGWRAYDLAPFVWGASEESRAAFLEGYRSVRPLSDAEMDALPALVKARAIWDEGDMLSFMFMWGEGLASEARLGRIVKNLRELDEKFPD